MDDSIGFPAPPLGDGPPVGWSRVAIDAGTAFLAATCTEAGDPISRDLASGAYPREHLKLHRLLRSIAPEGGRVLDLGGHVGTFALGAAAAGYEVVAVEASPRNASLLQASATRNDFGRMRVVHAAVSDRPGVLNFQAAGPYGCVAPAGSSAGTVAVPAVTVDALLAAIGWSGVDFIKLDVEGSEVAAVRGMSGLLGRADAPPIWYECNGHTLDSYGLTAADLKEALAAMGYSSHLAKRGRLTRVAPSDIQVLVCVDYLAFKSTPPALRNWKLHRGESLARKIAQAGLLLGSR